MGAISHGFGTMRKAKNPTIDEQLVIFHKPSRNYSVTSQEKWENLDPALKDNYEIAANLIKHSGPELTNMQWDIQH